MDKYVTKIDMKNNNSSQVLILKKIKPNSKILEIGSSIGYMTKFLKNELNCLVDIIEIDKEAGLKAKEFANKSFIGEDLGNVENYRWYEELKNEKYDYIILADVLEHLFDTKKILNHCYNILSDSGSILVSLPNISHNSIIINLLKNEFKYSKLGLLDETHIRFFTPSSFNEILKFCNLLPISLEGTYLLPQESEFKNDYSMLNPYQKFLMLNNEFGHLYQFIYEIKKTSFVEKNAISFTKNIKPLNFEIAELFIWEIFDNSYSENKKISLKYPLGIKKELIFDLQNFKNIIKLRFDPLKDLKFSPKIKAFEIFDDNSKKELLIEHSYKDIGGFLETGDDPQFEIRNFSSEIKRLEIIFEGI